MSETLDIWRPDGGVFARRTAYVTGASAAVLGLIGMIWGSWLAGLIFAVMLLAYFGLNDFSAWRGIRHHRWELTSDYLIHRGEEGESLVPLGDIAEVSTRFGWSVLVTLSNGQTLPILYVRYPKQIMQRIRATRAALLPITAPAQKAAQL
ncbi:MAG: hypothetical protein ACSHWZ_02220 [Sulfitobacter sp.]